MQTISFEKQTLTFEVSEEIKQLRTNLQFSGSEKKVFLITSVSANEGKSTITLELVRSLAELGKKVLLIDSDMRKSTLQEKVENGEAHMRGLSHFLSGQSNLEEVLYQEETEGFFAIMAGRVPPNPAELIGGTRMQKLIEWARTQFDYVIIDCPPIGLVSDPAMAAPMCDGSVVVVKAGALPRKVIVNGIKQMERTECPVLGVVLNQVDNHRKGRYYKRKYGYYGYYGYYKK